MRRFLATLAFAFGVATGIPAAAQADFGFYHFDVTFGNEDGTMVTQAGSHPFTMTSSFGVNFAGEGGEAFTEGRLRDISFEQVPGLLGDATAYPRCKTLDFLAPGGSGATNCPLETAVGISANSITEPGSWTTSPVFNVSPPPGVLLRLGFRVANSVNVLVDVGVKESPPFTPVAALRNTPQIAYVYASKTQLWGNPSSPAHDDLRGACGLSVTTLPPGEVEAYEFENQTGETCPVAPRSEPFLTLPTSCAEPLASSYQALSWEGREDSGSVLTHDAAGNPQPFSGCGKLGFKPSIGAQPTSRAAQSPTGLDFSLDVEDEGLTSVTGLAQSQIRRAVVTLPEGMTANPSLAEGLEVCSEADVAGETLAAEPGDGCPEGSKIGSVEVESPLVEQPVRGALYMAKPYENLADDSFLALYVALKNKELGINVIQPLRVEPDPETGQLITIAEEIPQLPFSHFRLHFREGGRSPLISPPRCGAFEATAVLTPWSGGPPLTTGSTFEIVSGPQEGPCPPGGVPPFRPGFVAGSVNNNAGSHSPFYMRLTRADGEQDMTKFSAVLPPGVVGKLAGVGKCPDAAIAQAKAMTGVEELASPSCPASSQIGRTLAGAGVGSQLTYVPGKVYLAGPHNGAPLSVVAITAAVAGPFDAGTVVVREALRIDPLTAEVKVDGDASDPIPHILKGIPLNVRDLRVYADRANFTLNPTNCEPSFAKATLFGGFLDPFSALDDVPVGLSSPYQAANCASLGFKPRLDLKLKGGTKRGGHPALEGTFRPRPSDANLSRMVLRLPRSAFLDQAHIRTICTRVQFAADSCPPGAIYGKATAFTPLLDEPLTGPVYLRSSDNNLPDFVADLQGIVDVEAVARIDSKGGGIRATFPLVPDAPISKVVVQMQGAKKGLIVNSTDLCAKKSRAEARMRGHNGRRLTIRPVVRAQCGQQRKAKRGRRG